jgi:hypothetical protein
VLKGKGYSLYRTRGPFTRDSCDLSKQELVEESEIIISYEFFIGGITNIIFNFMLWKTASQ